MVPAKIGAPLIKACNYLGISLGVATSFESNWAFNDPLDESREELNVLNTHRLYFFN